MRHLAFSGVKALRDPLHRNSLVLMLNSASSLAIGLVFWVIAARLYSTADVGLAAALVSASGLLGLFSLLGFDLALIRFLPSSENPKGLVNSCFTLATAAALLLSIAYVAGAPLWAHSLSQLRSVLPCFLLVFCTAATVLTQLQAQVFIGRRRPQLAWVQTLATSVVRIPFAVVLVDQGVSGIWIAWSVSLLAGVVVGNLLMSATVPGYRPMPQIDRKALRGIRSFSTGGYLANLAYSMPIYMLPLIVVAMLGAEANAYYYLGYRIGAVLYSIPWLVAMSLLVEGSHEPKRVGALARKSLSLILPILALALAVVFAFGTSVMAIFGKNYPDSARWILWTVSLSAVPYAVNEVYLMIKRVRMEIAATVYFCTFIGVSIMAAGWLAMARFGINGAGLGWIAGQTLGMLWVLFWLLKTRRPSKPVSERAPV